MLNILLLLSLLMYHQIIMSIQWNYWSRRMNPILPVRKQRTKTSYSNHIINLWVRIHVWVFWTNSRIPSVLNAPKTSPCLLILTNSISLGNDCRDMFLKSRHLLHLNYVHIVYDWGEDKAEKISAMGHMSKYPYWSFQFWGFLGDLIFTLGS